ncbi:bifunctional 2-polyprenyl-6-hydroxyphenol methylase/3-demethylubiquinol 3-O-methyltransferase UbiG [Planctobacterium marinum]|uniref:Ubiquinone biosynthesis O-methyltransferase n=1 Tax=Planctobacterium marinum TaxID=1631968 RepID=A0AA48I9Y9_9ALTE|nr:ubiquinone biosynthesis O-methyltransferase [Planctobacterium marinum]
MLDKSALQYTKSANTSAEEIARFDALAEAWWDPNGQYRRVLEFNACRWHVIERQIRQHFQEKSLSELSALDVGCGGGLLCEPLAQLGVAVTGIDASEMSIRVAQRHAKASGLSINYRHCLSEVLVDESRQFDIVMNTEVIEHVPDQAQLIAECCALLKPGGLLVLATLNRTFKSFLFGIVGAEYVLRLLPVGTHSWKAFVKPAELQGMIAENGLTAGAISGMSFNPFTSKWRTSSDTSVNYLLFAAK